MMVSTAACFRLTMLADAVLRDIAVHFLLNDFFFPLNLSTVYRVGF